VSCIAAQVIEVLSLNQGSWRTARGLVFIDVDYQGQDLLADKSLSADSHDACGDDAELKERKR
jgi:hypothetical protein